MNSNLLIRILYFLCTPLRNAKKNKWRGLFHYFYPFPEGYQLEFIEGKSHNKYRWIVDAKTFSAAKYDGRNDCCKAAWVHYAESKKVNLTHLWLWENRMMLNISIGIITILIRIIDWAFIEHSFHTKFQWCITITYFCFFVFTLLIIGWISLNHFHSKKS